MKKISFFFLTVAVSAGCFAQDDDAGIPEYDAKILVKIAKDYFRSDPYIVHFSSFLNHLMNDPTLTNETTVKRTDTTLFFFKGDYTTHNPFQFKAKRTEIRLAEQQIDLGDSAHTKDTILLYQLVGYAEGPDATDAVKKEFLKFERKYGKKLENEDTPLNSANGVEGMVRNYFFPFDRYSPLVVSWAKFSESQTVFTITFRIKVVENLASLPYLPGV
jgi:hypothetical protein